MSKTETVRNFLDRRGIVDAWVDPELGYANDPVVHVRITKVPDPRTMTYRPFRTDDGKTLWWAVNEHGWVRFLLQDPGNRRGYGGQTFSLDTVDGLVRVKGPWSSRSSVANVLAPVHCHEVNAHVADRDVVYVGANLTISTIYVALAHFCPNWTIVPDLGSRENGELGYALRWRPLFDSSDPADWTPDLEETHGRFLEWKQLMGTMVYGPGRWVA
jgi:hypothetical protein